MDIEKVRTVILALFYIYFWVAVCSGCGQGVHPRSPPGSTIPPALLVRCMPCEHLDQGMKLTIYVNKSPSKISFMGAVCRLSLAQSLAQPWMCASSQSFSIEPPREWQDGRRIGATCLEEARCLHNRALGSLLESCWRKQSFIRRVRGAIPIGGSGFSNDQPPTFFTPLSGNNVRLRKHPFGHSRDPHLLVELEYRAMWATK